MDIKLNSWLETRVVRDLDMKEYLVNNIVDSIEKMSNSYDNLYPDPSQYIPMKNEIKAEVLNNHQNLTAMEIF